MFFTLQSVNYCINLYLKICRRYLLQICSKGSSLGKETISTFLDSITFFRLACEKYILKSVKYSLIMCRMVLMNYFSYKELLVQVKSIPPLDPKSRHLLYFSDRRVKYSVDRWPTSSFINMSFIKMYLC